MPWPNDVVTRTVTGTYVTSLGAPAVGRVTFTPTARVVDINDDIVIEDTVPVVLDANGAFSVELPTTDNPLLSPSSWAYEVSVRLYGVKPQKFYAILPQGDGSDVDLNQSLSGSVPVGDATIPASTRGPIGPRAPGIIVGSGPPVYTVGQNGDVYIDGDTGEFYGPKTDGEWSGVPFFNANVTQRYVHTQSVAAATWTVTHPLNGRPSVTVVDSSGTVVTGEVRYDSNTVVTILFTVPFSGYAYLT